MENNSVVEQLKNFITAAQKSRKYNPNTASGIRSALRLFEKELNDEERKSLELLRQNLEQVYHQVGQKNMSSYNSKSLEEYKRRMLKLINDYEQYGLDPAKMAAWSPTLRVVKKANKPVNDSEIESVTLEKGRSSSDVNSLDLKLREGVSAIIQTPRDLTLDEAKKIRAYIDYLIFTIDPTFKPDQK